MCFIYAPSLKSSSTEACRPCSTRSTGRAAKWAVIVHCIRCCCPRVRRLPACSVCGRLRTVVEEQQHGGLQALQHQVHGTRCEVGRHRALPQAVDPRQLAVLGPQLVELLRGSRGVSVLEAADQKCVQGVCRNLEAVEHVQRACTVMDAAEQNARVDSVCILSCELPAAGQVLLD